MERRRLYIGSELTADASVALQDATTHYALNVLRLSDGAAIEAFDGNGNAFQATLRVHNKRHASLEVGTAVDEDRESPLSLHLLQVVSRGEKMDWTIQKAVELGVRSIRPLSSRYCNVKLDDDRADRRHRHWISIITSACEQCGRNTLPALLPLRSLAEELADAASATFQQRWLFEPGAAQSLAACSVKPTDSIAVLIGPEGGFSEEEIAQIRAAGFQTLRFGPRILRTETAAIASISAIQSRWGDMA